MMIHITDERVVKVIKFLEEEYTLAIGDDVPITAQGYLEAKKLIEDILDIETMGRT